MSNFFSLDFWLNQRPGILIPFWRNGLIAVIIFSFSLSAILFIIKKRGGLYAKLLEKIFTFFVANFFVSLFIFFFNQEMIPMLSSRFWYILWIIGIAVWIRFIIKYSLTLPARKKEIEKEKEFQKYLPK